MPQRELGPESGEREHLHSRSYEFHGYRRADGLWDIEGRLTDVKTYGFDNDHRGRIAPGEPIHDMRIRMTLDDDFVVRDVEAATEAGPFAVCPQAAPNLKRMTGVKVGAGWRRALRERLGGVEGCTHLTEMLGAMATVAFQTIYPVLSRERKDAARPPNPGRGRPPLLDSCHAFRSDGEIAKKAWPEFYTGD